ncbi:SUKH-4 family immunity protein [Kitasatospora sp. NA04385]|uniref:SUKH-4 family immunity protein n=1 Tax=Kitasatospora sp. NA04385 TaxID=2742135 RepID=UPI0015905640|nr:SUKH-4 family immunity protein [Kitasatospora sp. NA04385]QKW22752.1 SUKH-4 family immunity protein [Kitasatospora sp. NA04385]
MGSSRGAARRQSWTAELPQQAREFLDSVGVEWEPVHEGGLRTFARYVREYADGQEEVLHAGLRIMTDLKEHFQGPVYEALLAEYREGAEGRLADMVRGTRACADRLDVAAEVIAVMQSEVVEELTALAADRARPPEPRAAAARKHVDHLEEHLLHYVVDQVNEVAVPRLLALVERAAAPAGERVSAGLLAALDRGERVGPGHRVVSAARVARAAEAMERLKDRTDLLTEAFRARAETIDYQAGPGPDDELLRGFLIDRGTAVAVFGAERMVALTAPEALAGVVHHPSRVFLREVGLPDDTVFFELTREFCDGEPEVDGECRARRPRPSGAPSGMLIGGFGEEGFRLDTRTGEVYHLPEEGAPALVASSLDRFVLALAALETERPLYDPARQRFDHLDPDGVEERFLALLRRTDPDLPPGPGSYWNRVLEHVHKGMNGYWPVPGGS